MDLGFQQTKEISTNDLPYVTCEPPLTFEINLATSFELNANYHLWSVFQDLAEGKDRTDADELGLDELEQETAARKANALLLLIASGLLLNVTSNDGESFELGTPETIQELIDSTSQQFVIDLLKSWLLYRTVEIEQDKKKQRKHLKQSYVKNGKVNQIELLSSP